MLDFEQEKTARVLIKYILREIHEYKEIEYYDGNFMITASSGGTFLGNGGNIRSIYKRQMELENHNQVARKTK